MFSEFITRSIDHTFLTQQSTIQMDFVLFFLLTSRKSDVYHEVARALKFSQGASTSEH